MNTLALDWLQEAGPTFRSDLKSLRADGGWSALCARSLATRRLDFTALQALSRALLGSPDFVASERTKLSILSNANQDLIAGAITATGPRFDLWLDVHVAPFGTFNQECLVSTSETHARSNDFVLLAIDHRGHALRSMVGEPEAGERVVDEALSHLAGLAESIRTHGSATIIVQTLPMPVEALFGQLDRRLVGTLRWMVDRFNAKLLAGVCGDALVLDTANLADRIGLDRWHDATQWNVGKFPFALDAVPAFADSVCRLLAAALGKARKCLVLDLDNTLWGGVIGDDGLSGIRLGQGDSVGEAFLSVQRLALGLRERGIVLAVSSKNDEEIARQVFREHPDMLLREEHIAVFHANWTDKATNLRAIASTLNIGLDALVFVDDNPAERAQIRRELPMVAVPELPDAPEDFATTVIAAGYFEAIAFTGDDRARATQYQSNAARAAVLATSSDMQGYLASLAMQAHCAPFDAVGRGRIVQLINKTNQFNLCTYRYNEQQVAEFESDPAVFTLQIRLTDTFGDNGMISVVVCRAMDDVWAIDTWLMSCRVLNRRVEEAVLDVVTRQASLRGIARIVGRYRPTAKNGLVADHYAKLGFVPMATDEDGTVHELDVADYLASQRPVDLPIEIRATGFDAPARTLPQR